MTDTSDVRIRQLRRQWPDVEWRDLQHETGTPSDGWWIRRSQNHLVPRRAQVTFRGANGFPDVEVTVESEGPSWLEDRPARVEGTSWVSEVKITATTPGSITHTRVAGIDVDYLMHAALAHTGWTRAHGDRGLWDGSDATRAVAISASGMWEGNDPADALAAFHPIRNKTRRPAKVTTEFLTEVAEVYLREVDAGNRAPVEALAAHYGKAQRTAAGWLVKARDLGILTEGARKERKS